MGMERLPRRAMRRRATHCLCLVWATTCPLFAHAKDSPPPEYVRPAAVLRKFKAARAKVVFVDARPPEKDPAQTEQIDPKSDPLSENVLRPALEKLVEKALGQDNRELVFRVKLVEGREVSESPPTVRAVVDVFVERDGQTLASTRGSSTLVGSIGGMSPRTEERVQGAVFDAFERSIVRVELIDATNAALTAAPPRVDADAPATVAPVKYAWAISEQEASAQAHVLSAVFDGGETLSFAARYLHDHIHNAGGLLWGGYGAEVRAIVPDDKGFDAVAGLAIARGGFMVEQAFSLELGLGAVRRDNVRALGVAGVYFSFYYVDLGFTYQFVIAPTEDLAPLSGPHFGLRVYIPIDLHNRHVRCPSPLPCEGKILPWSGS